MNTAKAHRLLTLVKWMFTPLALGFLVYAGWQSQVVLATVIANAQFYFLLMAGLLLIFAHLLAPAAAVLVLKTCGTSVSYQFALTTHLDRLPARYLPGGIWHLVGRSMDFYTQGIKPPYLTAFVLLEYSLAITIAFVLGGALVGYFRGITDPWGQLAILAAGASLLGLFLIPALLKWQVLKSRINYHLYLACIGIYVSAWTLLATAFVCYLRAFPLAFSEVSSLQVGGTYLFAWAIGFIAIFAPQGLGVFELVAGHLLIVPISLGSMATLIAGFRVVVLVVDIVLWLLSRFTQKVKIYGNQI